MSKIRGLFIIIIFLFTHVQITESQTSNNWRFWTPADGLRERWTQKIHVSPTGNVWFYHGNIDKLSWTDGYHVYTIPHPGFAYVNCIFQTRSGDIWAIYEKGLKRYENGTWHLYPIDWLQENLTDRTVFPIETGRFLILQSDRIVEYQTETGQSSIIKFATQTGFKQFHIITSDQGDGAWIIGEDCIAGLNPKNGSFHPECEWREAHFDTELGLTNSDLINNYAYYPLAGKKGEISLATYSSPEKMCFLIHFDGSSWSTLYTDPEWFYMGWIDDHNQIWIRRSGTIFQIKKGQKIPVEKKNVLAGFIFSPRIESNGVFWLAGWFGNARYTPSMWRTPPELEGLEICEIYEDPQGRIWLTTKDSLLLYRDRRIITYHFPKKAKKDWFYNYYNLGLASLPDGRIVIPLWVDEILVFNPRTENFKIVPHPTGCRIRKCGRFKDGRVFFDVQDTSSRNNFRLEIFDGESFEIFMDRGKEWNLGIHLIILETENGDFWIAGQDGIARYSNGAYKLFGIEDGYDGYGALCMFEVEPGTIWFGTEHGIIQYDGVSWSVVRDNLNRVDHIMKSSDGSVWIATGEGVLHYKDGSWVLNGYEEGLPNVPIQHVFEDSQGQIWVSTDTGEVRNYHKDADTNPPITFLQKEKNLRSAPPNGDIQLVFGGMDKWKYTEPDRLLYSWRFDGEQWSPFTEDSVAKKTGLLSGPHLFEVRAMDRNFNVDPKGAVWEFTVLFPWYKEPGFLVITTVGTILIFLFAVYAINRHLRLDQSLSDLRISHDHLKATQNQLIQSEKMASLGQLVAGVAHEINNPINFIKGNIQPLKEYLSGFKKYISVIDKNKNRLSTDIQVELEKVQEDEELDYAVKDSDKLIKSFEVGSNRIAKIVADLRQYIQVEKDYQSSYDLHEAINSTLSLLKGNFENRITIHKEYGDIPPITCSPGQINQVFMNILKNAGEFIEEKGNVWITTYQESDNVVVKIHDDGIGIPQENISKVFDPFFTTKPVGSGTGLGLSLSYGIIEQHGGTITVESEEGKGTAFAVIIPVHSEGNIS